MEEFFFKLKPETSILLTWQSFISHNRTYVCYVPYIPYVELYSAAGKKLNLKFKKSNKNRMKFIILLSYLIQDINLIFNVNHVKKKTIQFQKFHSVH